MKTITHFKRQFFSALWIHLTSITEHIEKSVKTLETLHKHLFSKLKAFPKCFLLAVGVKKQIFVHHW